MTIHAVLPDTDAALINFYDTHADLVPLHGGRVGTTLAAGTSTSIRLTSLGGPATWPWETQTEYQVECWGGTELQASLLARTVYAATFELRSQAVTGGWAVTSYPTMQPFASPDMVTNRHRYILQVIVTASSA